jgi:hypothetical protein
LRKPSEREGKTLNCCQRIVCAGLIATGLTGCSRRTLPAVVAAPNPQLDWIDLQAGWRVRVVTPIQKSGTFVVKISPTGGDRSADETVDARSSTALDLTAVAGSDFLGYEVSLYSVAAGKSGGVKAAFESATVNVNGEGSPGRSPIYPLFQIAGLSRLVRILHMIRQSDADHDVGILAGRNAEELARLTREVLLDSSRCRKYRDSECSWVPRGIAVIPERRLGSGQWVPVL